MKEQIELIDSYIDPADTDVLKAWEQIKRRISEFRLQFDGNYSIADHAKEIYNLGVELDAKSQNHKNETNGHYITKSNTYTEEQLTEIKVFAKRGCEGIICKDFNPTVL